ncbi:CTP synthase [Candidatus Gugararchaeum adminiculabundum]|nr:CTP synthase [Candidatus Gugararchaeum adminiculabundum]
MKIAITGKYTALRDAYVSIHESLRHAGAHLDCEVELKWVETTHIEDGKLTAAAALKDVDALITPGGFGARGTEGKIQCIQYARENKIPFLGLCLGMQLMVVEWARNVAKLKDANSTEFNKDSPHPVIDILPEQKRIIDKGATMRLGAWSVKVQKGTLAHNIYKKETISERHRHRYEVNPEYVQKLKDSGLIISGTTEKGDITEICEWPGQFGIATQAHPEFKSRLEKPAPLFLELVRKALENQKK